MLIFVVHHDSIQLMKFCLMYYFNAVSYINRSKSGEINHSFDCDMAKLLVFLCVIAVLAITMDFADGE